MPKTKKQESMPPAKIEIIINTLKKIAGFPAKKEGDQENYTLPEDFCEMLKLEKTEHRGQYEKAVQYKSHDYKYLYFWEIPPNLNIENKRHISDVTWNVYVNEQLKKNLFLTNQFGVHKNLDNSSIGHFIDAIKKYETETNKIGLFLDQNDINQLMSNDAKRSKENGKNKEQGNFQPQDTDNSMIETIQNLLLSNHQVILTGAPGTGKTYTAQKVAEALTNGSLDRIRKVQFHPGYDYSDFVIGLKPKPENNQVVFSWEDGIFKKFADQVNNDNINNPDNINNNYVFIIDEINRADLSRVFGELFSILEEDYRGGEEGKGIILPNGNRLVIPNNLYIIGTMNDIDRSVESMDFALRRRFAWYEVSAESSECIIDRKNINGQDKNTLKLIMRALNKEIGNEAGSTLDLRLGKEYQLGGALFAKFEKLQQNYYSLWNNVIKIILNEYLRGRNNRKELLQDLEKIFNSRPQENANQSSEANVDENQERQEPPAE